MERKFVADVDYHYNRARQKFYNDKQVESQKYVEENNYRLSGLLQNAPFIVSTFLDDPYPTNEKIHRVDPGSKKNSKAPSNLTTVTTELSIQSFLYNGSNSKRTEQYPAVDISFHKPIPKYTLWTPIPHSSKTEDDPVLRHLHYFGEEDENDDDINYMEVYEDIVVGEKSLDLEGEKVAFITMKRIFENYSISHSVLESCAAKMGIEGIQRTIIIDDSDEDQAQVTLAEMLLKALETTLQSSGKELLIDYLEKINGSQVPSESSINPDVDNPIEVIFPHNMMQSYASHWCRRCYVYDCELHGTEFRPTKDKKRRRLNSVISEPCGPSCYMNDSHEYDADDLDPWNTLEIALFQKALEFLGKRNFCAASVIVKTKTCHQVYNQAIKIGQISPPNADENGSSSDESKQRAVKAKKSGAKIQGIEIDAANHLQYTPCDHPGKICDNDCPCFRGNLYCEKFCRCDPDCPRRFPGCNCNSNKGSCCNRSCHCFANYRECDPDLCLCSASDLLASAHDFDRRPCKNICIQRGKAKHTIVGQSGVAGWGLFVREHVKKNEFLGEYIGELISQGEADRRGKIYDKRGTSFLFNLNKDYVVDATRKGNKFRFVNHSSDPNSYARVTLVNGEHRIGIYAQCDLEPGQELFFDYRYDGESLKFVPFERERSTTKS
ncbi:hypothetical protein G9A89_014188 [Geosiphon pyriformis]|nr:hypothetical protein G9A89_014188 [Geosiphon pyriformis]